MASMARAGGLASSCRQKAPARASLPKQGLISLPLTFIRSKRLSDAGTHTRPVNHGRNSHLVPMRLNSKASVASSVCAAALGHPKAWPRKRSMSPASCSLLKLMPLAWKCKLVRLSAVISLILFGLIFNALIVKQPAKFGIQFPKCGATQFESLTWKEQTSIGLYPFPESQPIDRASFRVMSKKDFRTSTCLESESRFQFPRSSYSFLLPLSLIQNREPGLAKPPLPPKVIGMVTGGHRNLRSLKTASPSLRFNVALPPFGRPFPGPTIRQPLLVWVATSRISVRQTGVAERKSLPGESILAAGSPLSGTGRLKTVSYRVLAARTGFHAGGISPSDASNLASHPKPSTEKIALDCAIVKAHVFADLSGLVSRSHKSVDGKTHGPTLTGHQNKQTAEAARRVTGKRMQNLVVLILMSCSNVFDAIPVATENLSQEIYAKATQRSLWLNVIDRSEEAPRNAGTTFTTFTTGPVEPTGQETWSSITLSNGSNEGVCSTTYNQVDVGMQSATYSPERLSLKGPLVCRDDLVFDHNPAGFLSIYLQKLTQRAQRSWENRYENLYAKFARKWVANGNFGAYNDTIPSGVNQTAWVDANSAGIGLGEATSQLTQEMLDNVAISLIEEGATDPDSAGYVTLGPDGPVYPLIIGHEASINLLKNNSGLRDDIRYATQGEGQNAAPLLSRIGATRMLKNFRHVVTTLPTRFTYSAATQKYTYVAPYESFAGTKGTMYRIRAAWKNAPYEAAYVATPWVFKSRQIRPDSQVSNLNWDPKSYMGDWKWVTGAHIIDPACETPDPFGDKGQHFAQFMHAPEPVFSTFGAFIVFKRCISSFTTVTCT